MCFVLYMAADRPVPSIPCNEHDRKLSTSDLTDREQAVAGHFTKPHLKYVGSDLGCGCGFRNAMLQNGEWPEEEMASWGEPDTDESKQTNHEQLQAFLAGLLREGEAVELYGCWDEEFEEPCEGQATIALRAILAPEFHFRERFKYTVTLGGASTGGGKAAPSAAGHHSAERGCRTS